MLRSSAPCPFARPKLLVLTSDAGTEKKVFWKEGDDLRLDRVVLFMLDVFNGIWQAEQVRYGLQHVMATPTSRSALPRTCTTKKYDDAIVQAVTYRVANAGLRHGFVECLLDFKELKELQDVQARGV